MSVRPAHPDEGPRRIVNARAAIALTPHVVALVSATGVVLDVEPSVEGYFGYQVGELIGRSAFDFLDPTDHAKLVNELVRPEDQPTSLGWTISTQILHADGTWRLIDVLTTNCLDDPSIRGLVVAIHDGAAPSMSQRIIAASDYVYRSLETEASDGTTIFDSVGQRVFTSPSLLRLLGYSLEEFASIPPSGLVHPADLTIWKTTTRACLQTSSSAQRCELRIIRSDGRPLWVETTAVNLLDDPNIRGIVVHIRNVDSRRRAQEDFRELALTDELTGLGNRLALMAKLRAAVEAPGPVSLLFCDVDRFKAINDHFGHEKGDEVLRMVAAIIKDTIIDCDRETETSSFAARIGGDEFCVLLAAGRDMAEHIGERIGSATRSIQISGPDVVSGLDHGLVLTIDASIGIASGDDTNGIVTSSVLLTAADRDMYNTKRARRARITTSTEFREPTFPSRREALLH